MGKNMAKVEMSQFVSEDVPVLHVKCLHPRWDGVVSSSFHIKDWCQFLNELSLKAHL